MSACWLALSRFALRSESSVLVELASCSAFCREDSRLVTLVASSLLLVVCSDSCLLRFEISSSSDSIVADLDSTWAFRSSMEVDWLGEVVDVLRLDFVLCDWACDNWRLSDSTSAFW